MNHRRPEVERSEPTLAAGSASEERLSPVSSPKVQSHEHQGSHREESFPAQRSTQSLTRAATGPRTPHGKQRSRYNALKHGIFSEAVVLKSESRAEYQLLLDGLWEAFQPVGALEEVLVEKLATVLWRHRRLLVAEAADIRKSVEFLAWDQQDRQQEQAEEIGAESMLEYEGGLIRKIHNPHVLERCLELLDEFRARVESEDINLQLDIKELTRVYGEYEKDRLRGTLLDRCIAWARTAEVPEEERQSEGYASPAECKRNFLRELDDEVRRLKRYQKTRAAIESDRNKLEMLCRNIPDAPGLDRLLRYEASLERAFDRTLNQLERLQRMRLGQPVPPTLKVEVSK